MIMRCTPLALVLGLSLCGIALTARAADVPSFARDLPDVKSGEPILKFNGKDFSGFYVYTKDHKYEDPKQVFTVVDGMIRISGEEYGGIATGGNFRNYHLIAEWKWGDETWGARKEKTRDSGILLHCVGADGAAGGQWMESIECQIIEGGCGDFIRVRGVSPKAPSLTCETRADGKQLYYEKGGKPVTDGPRINWWGRDPKWEDKLGFRGKNDVEKPPGEWNRMEVICSGDTITNIVNGYVVNVGTRSSLTEGKIQFQSEGAEIFFRKIEIRPLLQ
jgi:hypothetical protein